MLLFTMVESEEDAEVFKALPSEKKFRVLLGLINRGLLHNSTDFQKALGIVGWSNTDFDNQFEELWTNNRIGWDELKILKSLDLISDRTLSTRLGQKAVCDRIPSKYHGEISLCHGYGE
jgi:hypothetical protein